MAGASAGLAPGTIGRIGRFTYVHFFLLAWGWPGAILATLATLTTLILLPLKVTIFLLTIIITIAKISYITAIFI